MDRSYTRCRTGADIDQNLAYLVSCLKGRHHTLKAFNIALARASLVAVSEGKLGIGEDICSRNCARIPDGRGCQDLPYDRWYAVALSSELVDHDMVGQESILRFLCHPGIVPDDANAVALVVFEDREFLSKALDDERSRFFHRVFSEDGYSDLFADACPTVPMSPSVPVIRLDEAQDAQRGYPERFTEHDLAAAAICEACAGYQVRAPQRYLSYEPSATGYISATVGEYLGYASHLSRTPLPVGLRECLDAISEADWGRVAELLYLKPHRPAGELAGRIRALDKRAQDLSNAWGAIRLAYMGRENRPIHEPPDPLLESAIYAMGLESVFASEDFLGLCRADPQRGGYAFALLADDPGIGVEEACRLACSVPQETFLKRKASPFQSQPAFAGTPWRESPGKLAQATANLLGRRSSVDTSEDGYCCQNSSGRLKSLYPDGTESKWFVAVTSRQHATSVVEARSFAACLALLGAVPQERGMLLLLGEGDLVEDVVDALNADLESGTAEIVYDDTGRFGNISSWMGEYILEDKAYHFLLSGEAPIPERIISSIGPGKLDMLSASLSYIDREMGRQRQPAGYACFEARISQESMDALSCELLEFDGELEIVNQLPDGLIPLMHVRSIRDRMDRQVGVMCDLMKIWKHVVGWVPRTVDDKGYGLVRYIARERGIDSFVSAYRDGVSIADLLS